jgi:transcriptional regulator with AAA-type ATPase domain
MLAEFFMKQYATKYFKPIVGFDKTAVNKLQQYHFPGNVRELQYSIERAVIMCDKDLLDATDLLFSPIENSAITDVEQKKRTSVQWRKTPSLK